MSESNIKRKKRNIFSGFERVGCPLLLKYFHSLVESSRWHKIKLKKHNSRPMQFRFPRVKNISTAQRALNLNKNGVKLFNQLGIAGNVLLIMPTLTSWRTPFVLGVSPKKKFPVRPSEPEGGITHHLAYLGNLSSFQLVYQVACNTTALCN